MAAALVIVAMVAGVLTLNVGTLIGAPLVSFVGAIAFLVGTVVAARARTALERDKTGGGS